MPSWKKVIVSGSNAELNNLSVAKASGSFSGSYQGDGSSITAVTAISSSTAILAQTASVATRANALAPTVTATSASTAVLAQTASIAISADTASVATRANGLAPTVTASQADDATTASFAATGDGKFSGSFSGSFQGDGSSLSGIATTLTIDADSGGTSTVALSSQTFDIAGTSNEIETTVSGQTVTVGLPNDVTIGNNLTVTDDLLSKTIISKYISTTKTYTVTVATKASTHRYYNNGSTLGYVIDGVPAPYITLTPGNTYRFDMSDTTNSTHPLHFFYNSDKSTPTGLSSNKYTTGVTDNYSTNAPGNSGSYLIFNIK